MKTRESIVAAARDLLLGEGVGGLSMRRVAERVGVSATALYRHFVDKEALLAAVLDEGGRALLHYFQRALRAPDPATRLLSTGEAYLEFAFTHPQEYRLLFMAWGDLAAIGLPRPPPGQLSAGLQFLVDRVVECARAGLLDVDPEGSGLDSPAFEIAVQCWALVHGLASLWLAGGAGEHLSLDAWRALCARALRREVDGLLRAAGPSTRGGPPRRRRASPRRAP